MAVETTASKWKGLPMSEKELKEYKKAFSDMEECFSKSCSKRKKTLECKK